MSQKVISRKAKEVLEKIRKSNLLKDFYLAGGTGLSLQLKHRLSFDFDFFTKKDIDTKNLIQKLKKLGKIEIEKEAENTLICYFNSTRITFLKYEYPNLFKLKKIEGIKVADSRDIGLMKIAAISSRGTKKDFIDLFFICQKVISLKKLLKLFEKKYRGIIYNKIHILKSLSYFEDAEKDPLPKMLIPVSWEKVKKFFEKEIKKIKWVIY